MQPFNPRKIVVQALCLIVAGGASAAPGQDDSSKSADAGEPLLLDRLEVTGSRIKRPQREGIEPLQVLSSVELQQQGFANLFDTLSNLSINTGVLVGEEVTNNFNANAQALDLRLNPRLSLGFNVVNLLDRNPPLHASERWWPYADLRKYNPAGAEYFLSLRYRL